MAWVWPAEMKPRTPWVSARSKRASQPLKRPESKAMGNTIPVFWNWSWSPEFFERRHQKSTSRRRCLPTACCTPAV